MQARFETSSKVWFIPFSNVNFFLLLILLQFLLKKNPYKKHKPSIHALIRYQSKDEIQSSKNFLRKKNQNPLSPIYEKSPHLPESQEEAIKRIMETNQQEESSDELLG